MYGFSVKSGMAKSKCDVCGKPTKGFTYICTACAFHMHPCCAMLNTEIDFPSHPHTLKIMPTSSSTTNLDHSSLSTGGGIGVVCNECKKKRSGKMYRCTVCDYYLHAFCAKSKINGLYVNGIKAPEKPSMLAAAAKVASQVVIEFIGGFVEGLGESMGEVLVQNIAKGGGSVTNNTNTTRPRK